MKKAECLEIRFYEMLGIKNFRKMVFALERMIHRKDGKRNINYHIPHHDVESFDAFTKYLFYNGIIHVRNIVAILLYFLIKILLLRCLHWFDFIITVFLLKDVFCVLLQRYNYLRIKQRKEILIKKRNLKIESEAAKVDFSAIENYSHTNKEQDLQLVRRMRDGFSEGHSVVLTIEDIERLNRLAYLLENRKDAKRPQKEE